MGKLSFLLKDDHTGWQQEAIPIEDDRGMATPRSHEFVVREFQVAKRRDYSRHGFLMFEASIGSIG